MISTLGALGFLLLDVISNKGNSFILRGNKHFTEA